MERVVVVVVAGVAGVELLVVGLVAVVVVGPTVVDPGPKNPNARNPVGKTVLIIKIVSSVWI